MAAEDKLMSGWLEKKGEVNTAWKKRWFDLKADRVEYKKNPGDPAKGSILLAGALIQLHPPKEGQWQQRLSIEDKSHGRTYWLRGNLNSLKEWNAALNTQITRIAAGGAGPTRKDSTAGTVVSSSDSEDEDAAGSAESLGSVLREGSLEKQGEKRKAFQPRWFKLYATQLLYFKSKGDALPRGRIPLTSAIVELQRGESDMFELQITPSQSERTYVLRLADDLTMKEWHAAIRAQTRPATTKPVNTSASAEALKAHAAKHQAAQRGDGGKEIVLSASGNLAEVQVMEDASMEEDLAQRHDGIIQLEKDMTELNAIFKDMAGIVREQGSTLNTIESNISAALEHSEQGLAEIRKADEIQSKRFFRFGGPAKEK